MGISLEEFEDLSVNGRYVFHLHTDYTDGLSTVEDYFRYASDKKLNTIMFTEHVRKKISYSFDNFLADVINMKKRFPEVRAIVGVEAKVLPGGDLDVAEDVLSEIQLICFACHSFPNDIGLYKESFEKLFADERWKKYIRVWVHAGRFLKRRGLLEKGLNVLESLINIAIAEGVFIEKNIKEELPPSHITERVPFERLVVGYDAHSVEELNVLLERNTDRGR